MAKAAKGSAPMTLEEELLAVVGVTDALVSIGESGPVGIQLEITPGSDREALVAAIGRILERRGFNADFPTEPAPPATPPSVAPDQEIVDPAALPPPPRAAATGKGPRQESSRGVWPRIGTVAVSENDRGVRIAVRLTTGLKRSTESPASEEAMWQALAGLLYEMAGAVGPRPLVETVEWIVIGGVESVVVVIAVGQHRRLGAAATTATRPLTVGRAIWAALA